MNYLDIGILAVIGISVLFGLYRGFISSVGNTGGSLIAFIASFRLYPLIANFVRSSTGLPDLLATYIDKIVPAGDGTASAGEAVSGLNLPEPIAELVTGNLTGVSGTDAIQTSVSDTLVTACINILSYVACFILLYILFSLLMSALRAVFKLPVLKQVDTAAGGIFGLLRGVVFVFVVFALVPVFQALVPGDTVNELISGSMLAGIFDSGALIRAILRGSLF